MSYMKELLCIMQEQERHNEDWDYDPNDWPSEEEIMEAQARFYHLEAEELASMEAYYNQNQDQPTDEEIIAMEEYYANQPWYLDWLKESENV